MIPQEAPNHCDKAVPRCYVRPIKLLGEFLVHNDHLYLSSAEDTDFEICRILVYEGVKGEGCLWYIWLFV